MSDSTPVKLVVFQLDQEPEQHLYEQDMIKVGRGRVGKAKTGVDLQLVDPDLARVHGVIQVKKASDVFMMPMGTAATYINGQKVKSRGKLENGTIMEMGTTRITVYIGEAAAHDYLSGAPVPGQESENTHQNDGVSLSEEELAIDTGEYEIVSSEHGVAELGLAPATTPGVSPSQASAVGWTEAFAEQPSGERPALEAEPATNPGHTQPPMAGDFGVPTQEYALFPMHAEPEGTFGPMGPPTPPIPEQFPGPNIEMLLEVHDRLGKESWYVQEILW